MIRAISKVVGLILFSIVILLIGFSLNHEKSFTDLNGKQVSLSAYQGKWMVINYWATWCSPCVKEIPELNRFYQSHQDKAVVIGVNFDGQDRIKQRTFLKHLAVQYPMLMGNPGKDFGIETAAQLPATFIISPQGKLVKSLYGPQNQKQLEAAIGFHPVG